MNKNYLADTGSINYFVVTVLFFFVIYSSVGYDDDLGYYIETHYQNARVPLSWTVTELSDWAGGADVGTYLKGAKYYIDNGEFEDWVVNLFPPGQMYYAVFLVKATGEGYFPLKMLITASVSWLLVFLVVTWILNRGHSNVLAPVIILIPMYFSTIRDYVFGYGMLGAEMLSMPLFVLLVYLVLLFGENYKKIKYLASVALILALLAYMRGYFEIFGNFLIIFLLLLIALNILYRSCHYHSKEEATISVREFVRLIIARKDQMLPKKLRSIAMILIIFLLLLLPWRLSNVERGFTMSWLHADYYWGLVWKSDEETHPAFRNTGINTPCRTDPMLCEILNTYENDNEVQSIPFSVYGKQAILTFLTKPVTWYKNKLEYFDNLWFGNDWNYELKERTGKFIEGVLILLAPLLFYSYYLINWKTVTQSYKDLYISSSVFVLFNIMLFTLLHFETRYSIFLKLLFTVFISLVAYDWLEKWRARNDGRMHQQES